jgi:hypothetical protein
MSPGKSPVGAFSESIGIPSYLRNKRPRRLARRSRGPALPRCQSGRAPPSRLTRPDNCWISLEPVDGSLAVLADYIGPHKIMWATDYPHSGFFPGAHRSLISRGEASGIGRGCYGVRRSELTGGLPGVAKRLSSAFCRFLLSHSPASTHRDTYATHQTGPSRLQGVATSRMPSRKPGLYKSIARQQQPGVRPDLPGPCPDNRVLANGSRPSHIQPCSELINDPVDRSRYGAADSR